MMCHCFDVCTEASTKMFLMWYFPLIIDCQSPYLDYVRTVYGNDSALKCPIYTHDFQFVYNTKTFQHLWPMATCHGNTKARRLDLNIIGSSCESSLCLKFKQKYPQRNVSSYKFEWYNYHKYDVMGVRWYAPDINILPIQSLQWVEIARWPAFPETLNAYGTWFSLAKGSGVFINVGKTYIVHKMEQLNTLEKKWATQNNISLLTNAHMLKRGFWTGMTRIPTHKLSLLEGVSRHEPYPYFAYEVGLDSLQVLDPPQIVITSMNSAVNKSRCSRCSKRELALNYSYKTSTCGSIVYKTGRHAQLPCDCSNSYGMTNCLAPQKKIPWLVIVFFIFLTNSFR
jgi:hypothetical protein